MFPIHFQVYIPGPCPLSARRNQESQCPHHPDSTSRGPRGCQAQLRSLPCVPWTRRCLSLVEPWRRRPTSFTREAILLLQAAAWVPDSGFYQQSPGDEVRERSAMVSKLLRLWKELPVGGCLSPVLRSGSAVTLNQTARAGVGLREVGPSTKGRPGLHAARTPGSRTMGWSSDSGSATALTLSSDLALQTKNLPVMDGSRGGRCRCQLHGGSGT